MKKGNYIIIIIFLLSLIQISCVALLDEPSHFIKPDPDCQLCQISHTNFITETHCYDFPVIFKAELYPLILDNNIPISPQSTLITPRSPPFLL